MVAVEVAPVVVIAPAVGAGGGGGCFIATAAYGSPVEKSAPALANLIRLGFDSLERIAEPNKEGLLCRIGTYVFPVLGKIAKVYLDAVDSEEFITNAYINTTISVVEFEKLHQQGIAVSPHVVTGGTN